MVLTGLYNIGEVPFHEVFIHPKILDGYGETMSKIEGQRRRSDRRDREVRGRRPALRPGLSDDRDARRPHAGRVRMPALREADRADARRTASCRGSSASTAARSFPRNGPRSRTTRPCRAGRWSSERFELARNFCNKLWNASRFALMNLEGYTPAPVADDELPVEDRWILSRLATVTAASDRRRWTSITLPTPRGCSTTSPGTSFAASTWRWSRPAGRSAAAAGGAARAWPTRSTRSLRLLHPMIPFITEEIWQRVGAKRRPSAGSTAPEPPAESVMIAPWPVADTKTDRRANRNTVRKVPGRAGRIARSAQPAEYRRRKRRSVFPCAAKPTRNRCLEPMARYFQSMAGATAPRRGVPPCSLRRCRRISRLPAAKCSSIWRSISTWQAEIARHEKQIEQLRGQIASKEKQLGNANFVRRVRGRRLSLK